MSQGLEPCDKGIPRLNEIEPDHLVKCFLYE